MDIHRTLMQSLVGVGLLLAFHSAPCAPFLNLDFESATVSPTQPGEFGSLVPISQGLPGWSGFLGNRPQSMVLHNNMTLGSSMIGIWGPHLAAIEGNFSALLQAGLDPENSTLLLPVSLSQSGFIPEDAQSIQLKAAWPGPGASSGPFTVQISGQPVEMLLLSSGAGYRVFGGDISEFAGSTADLSITASGYHNMLLDSITFSTVPIPEPSSCVLFVAGLLCLATFIRKRPRG
jgi:hypothetical protein